MRYAPQSRAVWLFLAGLSAVAISGCQKEITIDDPSIGGTINPPRSGHGPVPGHPDQGPAIKD